MDNDLIINLANSLQDRLDTMQVHAVVGISDLQSIDSQGHDLQHIEIDINGNAVIVEVVDVDFTDDDDDIYALSIDAIIRTGDRATTIVATCISDLGLAYAVAAATL